MKTSFPVTAFLGLLVCWKTEGDYYSPLDMCKFNETKWVNCNYCRCLWTWAMWSCTKNVCSPLEMLGKQKECYHGELKRKDCIHCVCQYGKWVCDAEVCNVECKDGSLKRQECNVCSCIGGKYRCTQYPCIYYYGFKCPPNSKKFLGCNECMCDLTGMGLVCTNMDCF